MMSTSLAATMMKIGIAEFLLVLLVSLSVSQLVHQEIEDKNLMISFLLERYNEKCPFQIKRNNDVIFDNEMLTEKYISELHSRASVWVGNTHNGKIIVHLFLEPVLRSDKGLYVCVFECPDDIQSRSFELEVFYPPGPAVCQWVKDPLKYLKFALQCEAQSGNPPGKIVCIDFEDEHTLCDADPLEYVTQEGIDVAFLNISREKNVSCCSVSDMFPKSSSTCHDFLSTSETVPAQSDKQENRPSTSQQAPAAEDPTKSINGPL